MKKHDRPNERALTRARHSWTFAQVLQGGRRAETLREAMVALYRKARRENEVEV